MIIIDRIYGEIEIKDKVLIDIIETPIFQRLKKISQDGAPHFIQPIKNVNRFEHSIGVWYLSNKFNRSLEEQIASLLHDLSHTAFSHVIDFVVENKENEYADKVLNKMIIESEIPEILRRNNIDIERVLDKTPFPLLDNSLPDLSVDRWDYFMRDGFNMGFIPKELIRIFLNEIYEKENIFYFKDLRLASTFAILFINMCRLCWLDPISHGSFFLLSSAIKIALDDEVITEQDFFTNDDELYVKLRSSKNRDVHKYLDRLNPKTTFKYSEKDKAEFWGPNKARFVDPFVENNGKLSRLSSILPSLKYMFEEFKERYSEIGVK